MNADNREDLLIRVASLYYEQDYNQQQIAEMLDISRSNISRLLKEAKQKGLVEIRVRKRITTMPDLEDELIRRFNLRAALVYNGQGGDYSERLAAAGQLAARYLEEILQPRDVLAISWGTGVSAAVTAMATNPSLQVDVVQMIGSVSTVTSVIDGPELARQLATKLGGQYYYLHAPLFVDNRAVRDLFLEQQAIVTTFNRAREANVALVGIGTTEASASSFLRAGHLTEEQLAELRAEGVVGESVGMHFDIQGNAAGFDINNRVIALSLADVRRIPIVVAVACGLAKRRAILGVLRGKHVNVLATDDITANAVLAEAREDDTPEQAESYRKSKR